MSDEIAKQLKQILRNQEKILALLRMQGMAPTSEIDIKKLAAEKLKEWGIHK